MSRPNPHITSESGILGERLLLIVQLWTERHSISYGLKEEQARQSKIHPKTRQTMLFRINNVCENFQTVDLIDRLPIPINGLMQYVG